MVRVRCETRGPIIGLFRPSSRSRSPVSGADQCQPKIGAPQSVATRNQNAMPAAWAGLLQLHETPFQLSRPMTTILLPPCEQNRLCKTASANELLLETPEQQQQLNNSPRPSHWLPCSPSQGRSNVCQRNVERHTISGRRPCRSHSINNSAGSSRTCRVLPMGRSERSRVEEPASFRFPHKVLCTTHGD